MVFRLNNQCLNPKPIEPRIFDESTINAMKWYSEHGDPEWSSTVHFIALIRKWWLKANVKTKYAA